MPGAARPGKVHKKRFHWASIMQNCFYEEERRSRSDRDREGGRSIEIGAQRSQRAELNVALGFGNEPQVTRNNFCKRMLYTLFVSMTAMTRMFPKRPTARTMEQRISDVVATYSARAGGVDSDLM